MACSPAFKKSVVVFVVCLLFGCGSNPTTIFVPGGMATFEVKEISKDEFELTLWGGGGIVRTPEGFAEAYDERAQFLCGGRDFLSNAYNYAAPYTSPGAFGSTNRHAGYRRFGNIRCKVKSL